MVERVDALDHERFDVGPDRGFLPDDPLASFPPDAPAHLHRLDELGEALPDLLERGRLGPRVETLPEPPASLFADASDRVLRRCYSVAGFLANAYVHGDATGPVPAGVAVPLYEAATRLGRTPVLSYDGYVLDNWRLADPDRGVTPSNLRAITTFTGSRDEEWFVAVHVAIERTAGPALVAIGDAQQAALDDDPARAARALETIADAVGEVVALLERMPERNDPERYATGFRPYLGSVGSVEFEGVPASGDRSFRGASAAQSSVLPALDAALGVEHSDDLLASHLHDLRADMPPAHRAFVEAVEDGPGLRAYAADADDDAVRAAYDACIDELVRLRERHLVAVERYLGDGVDEGTGGIPFGRFLEAFTEHTRDARL